MKFSGEGWYCWGASTNDINGHLLPNNAQLEALKDAHPAMN
jgi:hypothetical protein